MNVLSRKNKEAIGNLDMEPILISTARKKLALTQKQAADIVQVSTITWQQWELGSRKMHAAFWDLFLLKTNSQIGLHEMKRVNCEYTQKDIRNNQAELAKITHIIEEKESRKKDFTFIDLFCGVGGIRKAFESSGGGCVFSSEIDPFAQYTYYTNYGVVPYGDITKIDEKEVPQHDILCGGFPCQPFSHIGKREGFSHPTQGTMFHEVLRLINQNKPKAIFLENVPGLVNHDDGRTLEIILNELKKSGYDCHHTILNSHDFGVPQNRKRFYLVGFLENVDFQFPSPPMTHVDIGKYVEKEVQGYSISKHLQKAYLFKKDDGRPVVINQETKGSIKTLVSTYHKIQRLTGTFVEGGETGLRLLSEKECKSIMGFPEDFVIPVSRTQMYRQMGNSVVIPVIEAIANEMVLSLKKHKVDNSAISIQSHRA